MLTHCRTSRHGDLLFIAYKPASSAPTSPVPTSAATLSGTAGVSSSSVPVVAGPVGKRPWELAQEDPVDTYWRQKDGKIPRSRDTQFCKHGPNGMCDYCMPLEVSTCHYLRERIHNECVLIYSHMMQNTTQTIASNTSPFILTYAKSRRPNSVLRLVPRPTCRLSNHSITRSKFHALPPHTNLGPKASVRNANRAPSHFNLNLFGWSITSSSLLPPSSIGS